jgi:hypothetical protein
MPDQLQLRGGTTAQHASFTGASKEVTVDTTKKTAVVHDGATAGGNPLLREDGSNSALALGSQGTPSLKFTGDTNTGIYSPGADQVAISTNGTGRLFVDSSGRVRTSGNISLDGNSGGARYIANLDETGTYTGRLVLQAGGGSAGWGGAITMYGHSHASYPGSVYIGTSSGSSGSLIFGIANALDPANEKMRLDSSGRLGLGTSSPTGFIHIQGTSTGTETYGRFTTGSAAGDQSLVIKSGSSRDHMAIQVSTNAGVADDLALQPDGGRVGIGVTSPAGSLDVATTGGRLQIYPAVNVTGTRVLSVNTAGSAAAPIEISGTQVLFTNGNNTPVGQFDTSGRLLVGTSSSTSVGGAAALSQIETGANIGLSVLRRADTPIIAFGRTGGSGSTIVNNGDELGAIRFAGADGSTINSYGASISCAVDGTPGANDMPGRLVFSTTADGASSPTERMRIDSSGNVIIGKAGQTLSYQNPGISLLSNGSADFTRASAYLISCNRKTDDGVLVEFYQDNALEGTISVSGTTVSYNGAHLSRWSQLPGGAERTEILRGTVLSNIDEMCGWGEEDNEQLNRMKVSDVEGDPNVSGVFQAWDDDDDTYTDDFYCAMTGDFVIRIAEGVMVQRGDLLMSAGDGTAKPQDDDIIRSKTIAKVTSTHVTCTYEDGSYCVPCVLMAC